METKEHQPKTAEKGDKKVLKTAVGVAAAASLLVNGAVAAPVSLLNGDEPTPVIGYLDGSDLDDGGSDDGDQDQDRKKKPGRKAAQLEQRREGLERIPMAVRLLVLLPLWLVGWALSAALSALGGMLLSPVAGAVLGAAGLGAALTGAFVLAAKTLFPNLPLKEILTRRNLGLLLGGAVVLSVGDGVLSLVWSGYGQVKHAVMACGFLLVLSAALTLLGRRRVPEQGAEAEPEMPIDLVDVLEITDDRGTFLVELSDSLKER